MDPLESWNRNQETWSVGTKTLESHGLLNPPTLDSCKRRVLPPSLETESLVRTLNLELCEAVGRTLYYGSYWVCALHGAHFVDESELKPL